MPKWGNRIAISIPAALRCCRTLHPGAVKSSRIVSAALAYLFIEAKYAATSGRSASFTVPAIIFIVLLFRLPDL